MKLRALILLIALTIPKMSNAAEPTGRQLVGQCSNESQYAYCMTYIVAAVMGARAAYTLEDMKRSNHPEKLEISKYCWGANITGNQLVAIYLDFMIKNQNLADVPASYSVVGSFLDKFCSQR